MRASITQVKAAVIISFYERSSNFLYRFLADEHYDISSTGLMINQEQRKMVRFVNAWPGNRRQSRANCGASKNLGMSTTPRILALLMLACS